MLTLTRDAILERKSLLDGLRQQHLANANACVGALHECDYLLTQLDAAEATAQRLAEEHAQAEEQVPN